MNSISFVKIDRSTPQKVEVDLKYSGEMRRFFNGNVFFVEYDVPIDSVPESILVVPALATLVPVAWACNADVYVPQIDEEFMKSLEELKYTFRDFHPSISWNGQLHSHNIINKVNKPMQEKSKSAIMFSGGVDSLFSFIRHKSDLLDLITVNGSDIDINNAKGWANAMEKLQPTAKLNKVRHFTIRSNFRSILDYKMLSARFIKPLSRGWWPNVQADLGLVGLCAPLTYVRDINKLYLASGFPMNFYSHVSPRPCIHNKVRWSNTIVSEDGFEFTRQEKIHFLADYIRSENSNLYIRTCWESDTGGNCSKCEKCSRTIVGLELEGINPNKHGYKVDERTFDYIKTQLETKKWHFGVGKEFFWNDLKSHVDLNRVFPHPEAREFMLWLAKVDIYSLRSHDREPKALTNIKRSLTYLPKPIFRLLFWLFRCLKKFYLILFTDGHNVK